MTFPPNTAPRAAASGWHRTACLLVSAVGLAAAVLPAAARADLADTIASIKPSIVIVGTYHSTDSPRFGMSGSGFVAGTGNLIVTNAHVVEARPLVGGERELAVQVRDAQGSWEMRRANVLELDRAHDLALLRIGGSALPALQMQDSTTAREGQAVAIMGFPIGGILGYSTVTHRAMISSITPVSLPAATGQQLSAKVIRSLRGGSFDIFQLDGTAYPGNSGGPLFNPETGAVLGVVNMVFVKGTKEAAMTHPSGISYAIPSVHIIDLLGRHRGN